MPLNRSGVRLGFSVLRHSSLLLLVLVFATGDIVPDLILGTIFSSPVGVAVDPNSNDLYVSDAGHSRVLRFGNRNQLTNSSGLSTVFGQRDFTQLSLNAGMGGVNPEGLHAPWGIVVDNNGSLWVADYLNNRVLQWQDAATDKSGMNASTVLGQSTFYLADSNATITSASQPTGIRFYASDLWVVDSNNNRFISSVSTNTTTFNTN